jgi:hypothetical protein
LKFKLREVSGPHITYLKDVARDFEDSAVRKERAMIPDGEPLEDCVHLNCSAAVS